MNSLIATSKAIAILSFIIGTILCVTQLYHGGLQFITIGFLFIIGATIANLASLVTLIFYLLGRTRNKLELAKTCGLVITNIPVVIINFNILFKTPCP